MKVRVATPLASGVMVARDVVPLKNVTEPGLPGGALGGGITRAVRVTDWPKRIAVGEAPSVVMVDTRATWSGTAGEVVAG